MEKVLHRVIKEICEEENINLKILSYGWILELSKGGKIFHILGNKFDLNPDGAGNIASDKYATYDVLKESMVPVIEHTMVFNPKTRSDYAYINNDRIKLFKENILNDKVVVKPNNGLQGKGVYLCNSLENMNEKIQELFNSGKDSISICPYYNIKKEYRTFYLNGEVLLIYGKNKPFVVGDGKTSLKELIEKLNLPNNNIVQENLEKIDLQYIPKQGEKVEISWKHNLSGGGTPELLEKGKLYSDIEKIAINAGQALNIRFATIDIIDTEDNGLLVLEINSGVAMTKFSELTENGYEISKEIYRKAIKSFFDIN